MRHASGSPAPGKLQHEGAMKTFPMFLKMAGRRVVIIGGGEQAAQKARLMLKTEAQLALVAPALDPELSDLVATGRASMADPCSPGLFQGGALVFVATGCKGADAAWHARAKAAGALVNVVDYPELCDAMTPSIVDRDPVVVAIGTEGTAPVLGRRIKTQVEELLHPRLGSYAALAGRLRTEVAHRVPARLRRDFWRWVFSGAPWRHFSAGQERAAMQMLKQAIGTGHRAVGGHLTVVLGASDPGLIPMAAVQRLQEADIIYLDRDLPESILELARRDAERHRVDGADRRSSLFDLASMLSNLATTRNVVYLCGGTRVLDLPMDASDHPVEQIHAAQRAGSQAAEAWAQTIAG